MAAREATTRGGPRGYDPRRLARVRLRPTATRRGGRERLPLGGATREASMAVRALEHAGGEDIWVAVLARREECVFAGMDAAAPVYMLAAWRWGVEWPSGELSCVYGPITS